MASNVVLASSQQPKKGDLSLFASSDLEIMNQIYATHVHNDEKFDVESLFIVVENILKRATQIVDNVVLGTPATVEHLEEKTPKAGFSPPLCTLKSISCEMQCKAPGEETAYKTTLSILNKLSNYSWDTKAVLTLAAFALDYGEFWLLAQSQSTDQLAKSVGTLRRVSVLLKRPTLQKHRQALIELNTVIKSTLEVIECIFELEKLSNYDTKDVPALSTGMDHIPVDVFWAIVTVVASTTQLCCLTSDDDKKQELSLFSQKLNVILTKLKRQITICRQQVEETEAYWKLTKLFRTPTEIMEIIKGLIYSKDNVQPSLIDGSPKKPMHFVYVNVVRARDLPAMDVTGSLDPFVEVKVGNYKGTTKHLVKNQHPEWKQVFAFSRERIQANLLEVTVMDKDKITKDDFVGRVTFDLTKVPLRVSPDGPLAPQWYKLVDKKGNKTHGEVMLAVWMGTQADESFPEAWHSDAHNVSHANISSTLSQVDIDVLKRKNVLLFISGLDITDEDISILRPIYYSIRKDDQYKIVWIPIVDQWTDDLRKKFEFLRSKMPWYVVQCFSPIAGIRFVKEKWHFKGKPSVVVLNPQGKVEHENAIHMIRVWGIKAFPFTTAMEETLSNGKDWIGSIATNVHPNIDNWIKDQKYIFFYGGKDKEWIQQFTNRATALANDATMKEARISIELVSVGKGSKGEDNLGILGKFWTGIESLFISKTHRTTDADSVTLEIQKLLSYKNESGWALLSKGSNVVLSGHGTTILKVVEEFDKWKKFVQEKGFEFTFKEYHNRVLHTAHICCRIDIPNTTGRIPENMKCPDCPRIMETYISFKCCHIDGAANGVH